MRITGWMTALMVATCCVAPESTSADEQAAMNPATQLTRTLLQDEVDELPADNTAFFSAARQVKVKLDLMAAMQDEQAELESALVTVVRPSGETTRLTPDADGLITIDAVQPGAHALVASADRVHGAMLYYFDEVPPADARLPEPRALAAEASTVQMTMLRIRQEELHPSIDRIRDLDSGTVELAGTIQPGARFNYRTTLDSNGTLLGQVVLVGGQPITPGGVNIDIFFNGNRIGSARSDDSGVFRVAGLRPGVHGLVASGPAGYSAFAFAADGPSEVAQVSGAESTLVSLRKQGRDPLPVVMCPPQFIEPMVDSITDAYPQLNDRLPSDLGGGGFPGDPIGPTVGGLSPSVPGAMGPGFGGGGGGFAGGGGGGGGIGGLAGLAGLAAVGVVAATSDDDNNAVVVPEPASPSLP